MDVCASLILISCQCGGIPLHAWSHVSVVVDLMSVWWLISCQCGGWSPVSVVAFHCMLDLMSVWWHSIAWSHVSVVAFHCMISCQCGGIPLHAWSHVSVVAFHCMFMSAVLISRMITCCSIPWVVGHWVIEISSFFFIADELANKMTALEQRVSDTSVVSFETGHHTPPPPSKKIVWMDCWIQHSAIHGVCVNGLLDSTFCNVWYLCEWIRWPC